MHSGVENVVRDNFFNSVQKRNQKSSIPSNFFWIVACSFGICLGKFTFFPKMSTAHQFFWVPTNFCWIVACSFGICLGKFTFFSRDVYSPSIFLGPHPLPSQVCFALASSSLAMNDCIEIYRGL